MQSKVAHGLTHGWPPPQVIRSTGQLREAWPSDIIHPHKQFPSQPPPSLRQESPDLQIVDQFFNRHNTNFMAGQIFPPTAASILRSTICYPSSERKVQYTQDARPQSLRFRFSFSFSFRLRPLWFLAPASSSAFRFLFPLTFDFLFFLFVFLWRSTATCLFVTRLTKRFFFFAPPDGIKVIYLFEEERKGRLVILLFRFSIYSCCLSCF